MRVHRLALLLTGIAIAPQLPAAPPQAHEPAYFHTGVLDLEARIWAQTQIERVFYNHRIWPKENPGPKPPFEAMVPAAAIADKVSDSLRGSDALERRWNTPLAEERLRAEVARMAANSRDPATLRELFAALHDDGFLIAETLARQALAERELRARYAADRTLHEDARAAANRIYVKARGTRDWTGMTGYARTVLMKRGAGRDAPLMTDPLELEEADFAAAVARLPAAGADSGLVETVDGFVDTRTVSLDDGRAVVETLSVPKRDFDAWWAENRGEFDAGLRFVARRDAAVPAPEPPATGGCDQWGALAPFADQPQRSTPAARDLHTAVWTGSEMIVWGGNSLSAVFGNGGRYSPATDGWTAVTMTGAPSVRYDHTAVWTGSVMIVWGGRQSGSGPYLNTGARYDPATDGWLPTSTGANVPAGRYGHSAVWTGGEMLVWGGYNGTTFWNTGGRYNPATDGWLPTSTGANVPAARLYHAAVWTGNEMLVWGGYNGAFLNSGGRYNPATDGWLPTSTGANVPQGRYLHSAVWTGGEMLIWGGTYFIGASQYQLNSGGRYSPATDGWLPTSTGANAPAVRASHTAVWTGAEMIVWGGNFYISGGYTYLNTGGRYSPSANSWQPTSTGANAPGPRAYHTAVWTGAEMIVWGGDNYFGDLNSGGRYAPSGDSWTATSIFDGVNSRQSHTAVWTGAEMIIWGGQDANSLLKNNGGRYVPATDSWSNTVLNANTPAARKGHVAVWTGREMLVWGSRSGANSGGRYNPATGGWLPTSVGANVPAGRSDHTAVWTGTEMIVWGGNSPVNGELNSGGRYNPATDSWLPTSTGAAPSARASHTAVWTGGEMIVWGGSYNSTPPPTVNYLNTGGRYSPATDAWTALTTFGAPGARAGHSGAWAGGVMTVWGGGNGGGPLADGSRYNPAGAGSWSAITNSGAPSARSYDQTAISTGSAVIVWGGSYLNTGGRYNPTANGWAATSTGVGVPAGRSYHTAVWSGQSMLVWGGNTTSSPSSAVNTGGTYLYGPDSPANTVKGSKPAGNIGLTWTAASGATSYNVRRCVFTSAACTPSTIVGSPAIPNYSEANDANSYMYSVESVNACGATP